MGRGSWIVVERKELTGLHRRSRRTTDRQAAIPGNLRNSNLEKIHAMNDEYWINFYREKWHEARRHLRAANKGAERSAKALELSVTRYHDLINRDKRIKERNENEHKTIVWNWLLLSDEDLRLKCGELSPQDIRNIRAVLRAMLGSSVRLKHEL